MRILAGHIYHESNTFSPQATRLEDFEYYEGERILSLLPGVDVLQAAGAEVIPSVYAARWSSGTVEKRAFLTFQSRFMETLLREKDRLDGIFLSLHGAMAVEELGSGEYELLRGIREAVGDRLFVSVSLDMHANNRTELAGLANVLCGYHTAPHTDAEETQRKAAGALLRLIKSGETVHPCLIRLPMLLVGERALSADEPFRTIYKRCKELEQDSRILAATLFVGMAWSDTPYTSCSVSVTPSAAQYTEFAEKEARKLASYLYAHREICRYAHPSFLPREAVKRALVSTNAPLYLSDSGDNPTAGGVGDTTVLLALFQKADPKKRVLFAPIFDAEAYEKLLEWKEGDSGELSVGSGRDKNCEPVLLRVQLLKRGDMYGKHGLTTEKKGSFALVRAGRMELVIVNAQMAFTGMECFESVGVSPEEYGIVVLKMGYMFDEISAACRENIMALTPGCTPLLITGEQYHHLKRPIWPLDADCSDMIFP